VIGPLSLHSPGSYGPGAARTAEGRQPAGMAW
jgi:hypothetical protein